MSKIANSLAELLEETSSYGHHSADYFQRMMHKIPEARVVNRTKFILAKCAGKRVVNFGSASGYLHGDIKAVAASIFGVDKVEPADLLVDLDDEFAPLHGLPCGEVYVCGEIIEHLANPGMFLKKLRWTMKNEGEKDAELIVTVPNALASVLRYHAMRGTLNVNEDHVAWYCWKTLQTLLSRYGFTIIERACYEGQPVFSEGLIAVVR
jgi:2-polyprenyl-3-methyl-5-hydroxy-6-metoxy-1,4-benzoquinol methylase